MSSLSTDMFQQRSLKASRQPAVPVAPPTLSSAALDQVIAGFEAHPTLTGVPAEYASLLAERLPVDYDVRLTVPNVHNESYFRRVLASYGNAFGSAVDTAHHGGSYKQAFCERYVAHLLETFGVYDHSSAYEAEFCRPPIDSSHPAWQTVYPKTPLLRADGLKSRERSCLGSVGGEHLDGRILAGPDSGWPYLEALKAQTKSTMPKYEGNAAWSSGVDKGARATQAQAQLAAGTTKAAPAQPTADKKDAKAPEAGALALPEVPDVLTIPHTELAAEAERETLLISYARDDAGDCTVDNQGSYCREWVEPAALAAWRASGAWPETRSDSLLTVRAKELVTLLDRIACCEDNVFNVHLSCLPSHLDMELVTSRLPNLTVLSVSYGPGEAGLRFDRKSYGMTVKDMDCMCRAIKGAAGDTLTTLALPACGIDDALLSSLVSALLVNNTITHLDLSCNAITAAGVELLAKFMRGASAGCVLSSLTLADNAIGTEGGKWLGRALKYNDTVTHLDCKQNMLGDEGCALLVQELASNITLQRLSLACNGCGARTAAALAHVLAQPSCTLDTLDVSNNDMDAAALAALEDGVRLSHSLCALDCRGNAGLGEKSGAACMQGMQEACRKTEGRRRGGLAALAPLYTAVVTG